MTNEQKIAKIAIEFAIENKKTSLKELHQRLKDVEAGVARRCPPHDPCAIGYIYNEFLCRCDPDL